MTTMEALIHRVNRMLATCPQPGIDTRNTDEWQAIRSIITQTVVPWPEVAIAVDTVLAQIESLEHASNHEMQRLIVQALNPFLDARIAIADALEEYETEYEKAQS